MVQAALQELNAPDRRQPIHALLEQLKAQVYPKIDTFSSQARIVLSEFLWPEQDGGSLRDSRNTHTYTLEEARPSRPSLPPALPPPPRA